MTQPAPRSRPRLVERYRAFLPVTDATPPLTLGEGFTPLVRLARLGAGARAAQPVREGRGENPTGSFKDRGMVVAVSKALEEGAQAVICASTGNTSASAAAYAAAAGIECVVILPKGQIAVGKLLQALVAGARVVAVDGNFDQALSIVRSLAEQDDHPVALVNSINPDRLEGQKTAAFEVCDDLGRAPDILALPGRQRRQHLGLLGGVPRVRGAGGRRRAAADVGLPGGRLGADRRGPADRAAGDGGDGDPDRQPGIWDKAVAARDESGGRIDAVTDDEILAAYRELARLEGIFCEPSSAAGIAGVRKAAGNGELEGDEVIVCVLTGHGLKDPTTAEKSVGSVVEAEATVGAVAVALGW